MVKGMRRESALRIERARAEQPFSNVQDLASRAALDRHDLAVLAEAATLRGLAGHRHRARWEIAAVEKPVDDLLRRSEFYSRPGIERVKGQISLICPFTLTPTLPTPASPSGRLPKPTTRAPTTPAPA